MKIKDICTSITDGSHNPPQGIPESNYLMLSSKNIFDDCITTDEPRYLSKEDYERENKRTGIQPGDVLLTIVGTVGRAAVVPNNITPFTLQRSVAVLRPKTEICLSRFLMYALRSNRGYIERTAKGVAQKGIYLGEVANIDLPVPSMKQQAEIIGALDRANEVIQKRQQQLQAFDTLIKARFVEMFGAYNADCCSRRIGDYAQVLGGYAFKSDEFIQDAIPVIRISNINEGQIIPDYTVCFSEQFWLSNPKFRAVSGDILMAMSGATTGKAGILRSDERLLINQRVACIRAKEGISLPEFIYAMTQLSWVYDLIQDKSAGCAQPNISGKQIENMPIPKATYVQQKEFAAFVSRVDKSKVIVQQALEKAQMLFDSLMQQYFG